MNEDICKREIRVNGEQWVLDESVKWLAYKPLSIKRRSICNKPKNPEFIYCEDCMKEVFDENSLP